MVPMGNFNDLNRIIYKGEIDPYKYTCSKSTECKEFLNNYIYFISKGVFILKG